MRGGCAPSARSSAVPALAADERGERVEGHGGRERAPLARRVRELRRRLVQRPVDDAGHRDGGHGKPDQRQPRAAAPRRCGGVLLHLLGVCGWRADRSQRVADCLPHAADSNPLGGRPADSTNAGASSTFGSGDERLLRAPTDEASARHRGSLVGRSRCADAPGAERRSRLADEVLMTPSAQVADGRRVTRWTRDTIIEKIREWNDRYGEPPCSADWNPSLARWRAQEWRAERYRDGVWPSTNAAKRPFDGSFDAAVRAAGLEPHRPGPRRRAAGRGAARRRPARAAGAAQRGRRAAGRRRARRGWSRRTPPRSSGGWPPPSGAPSGPRTRSARRAAVRAGPPSARAGPAAPASACR